MRHPRILPFACALLLLFACSSSDDDGDGGPTGPGDGKPTAQMIGKWTYAALTIDGMSASLRDEMNWDPLATAAHLHVYDTSAFVYEEVDARGGQIWAESGFVFVDGDEIDVNIQSDSDGARDETIRFSYFVSDTALVLTIVEGGQTKVFALSPAVS